MGSIISQIKIYIGLKKEPKHIDELLKEFFHIMKNR